MGLEDKFPYDTEQAQIGDIITSSEFVDGHYKLLRSDKKKRIPEIDRSKVFIGTSNYLCSYRDSIDNDTGEIINKDLSLSAKDESRGKARFVVEEAFSNGGGAMMGMGGHMESYHDGWHVRARRLNGDGTYNPKGELIDFYQTEMSESTGPVTVIGKLKRTFI